MKTLFPRLLLVIVLFLVTAITALAQDEVHQSFSLNPNGTVSVSNVSGGIRITGWNENRVQVDAVKRGSSENFSQVQIRISDSPDKLEISTVYPPNWRYRLDVSVEFELKVPHTAILNSITSTSGEIVIYDAGSRVTARTTSGEISARGTKGDTSLSSTSGNITAENIGGTLTVHATSGGLRINNVASKLSARTTSGEIIAAVIRDDATLSATSGDVRVEKVGGRVIARSISGKVWVKDVSGDATLESISDAVVADSIKGRVTASAISADMKVTNVQEGVRANAVSGNIIITSTKGLIEANTTSADITLQEADSHEVLLRSHSGRLTYTGAIHNDGRYNFESFSGGILVYIPASTSFNLTATTYNGSIETDFPLTLTPGVTQQSRPRRLQGSHGNSDGAQIKVSCFNANIKIKRR